MKGCTQVYHTAAIAKLWAKNRDIFYEQNVGCTINVLDAALECDVKKLVYTSSCGVWSPASNHLYTENDPRIGAFDNDYDLSKYLAEKAVREYGQKGLFTVIVNPPRVYGPGLERSSSAVNRFIHLLLAGRVSVLPWSLDTKANYTFIDDVVQGVALERLATGSPDEPCELRCGHPFGSRRPGHVVDLLFLHGPVEIVHAEPERRLRHRDSGGNPKRFDVRNVVAHQPRDRVHA